MTLMKIDVVLPYFILAMCTENILLPIFLCLCLVQCVCVCVCWGRGGGGAYSYSFSAKIIRILYIESAKTINEMTLNELVKLTML